MRIGLNPYKDKLNEPSGYSHQVIVPVYIPDQEGYFKDSYKILRLCLTSIFETTHEKTFITVVNNGSDKIIVDYLDSLFVAGKIHELIHTQNIGKLNAILKGLSGNSIELVTITDSDVLFLSGWQKETNKVFSAFPRAGVVGIVPQFRAFSMHCQNLIFDNFFNKNLRFIAVKNPGALEQFYSSLGWGKSNPDYLKQSLGLVDKNDFKVYVGSGHFVATYKKDMFDEIVTNIDYKMGGDSEHYLDSFPLKKDYWRLTTYDNYGYHMGNAHEQWMDEVVFENERDALFESGFKTYKNISGLSFFVKNQLFRKLFRNKRFRRLFYGYKGLPKSMIQKY